MITLWSIGHSRHPIEHFLWLLDRHDIKRVVDVRSRPFSRFSPWFNQTPLTASLKGAGLDYETMGDHLGGKDDVSVVSGGFVSSMGRLISLAGSGRTAIMCSEADPGECHRAGKLMAYIHRQEDGHLINTVHILKDGETRDARQFEPKIIRQERWGELAWGDVPLVRTRRR